MARRIFIFMTIFSLVLLGFLSLAWPSILYLLLLVVPFILLGVKDMLSSHSVLRNYPVIGHLRYLLESIRPEIRQYFIAGNLSDRPYSRETRSLIYQRAKNVEDTHPFGTEHDVQETGYLFAGHSMKVQEVPESRSRLQVGGAACEKPYQASLINISAMSYGALSRNAIRALNLGAKQAGIYHNTGEGGLTSHHLSAGADVVWQIGTGYFGCRNKDGNFEHDLFVEKAQLEQVKMIEIKLSQGAKPSHGGILPADKISKEISEIRGIPMGQDCLSPPTHKMFDTPLSLLAFVQQLRELSGGKPVGFKLAIGIKKEFMGICKAMLESGIYPDYIVVDGAEGGTGAAPLIYSNHLGLPGDEALAFVHNCLTGCGLRNKLRLIASAKVASGFDIARKFALGANMVNIARGFMFSLGCIQAMKCNTNECPTGVTSNKPSRYKAIVIEEKAKHVHNFHRNTMSAFLDLIGALGFNDPQAIGARDMLYRKDIGTTVSLYEVFHFVEENSLLNEVPQYYLADWEASSAQAF